MAIVAGGGNDIRHKGANDESNINSTVGKEDKPPIASACFQLARRLRTAYGASRVFTTYANTDKETPYERGGKVSTGSHTSGE